MNDKTIKDIDNSTVIQTGNHATINNTAIYNGLSIEGAIELLKLLVEKEMALFKQEARIEVDKRFNEIKDMIFAEIAKQNERLLERFKDPAIQIALHETMYNYIKTGDEKLGHMMVGYLIDRLHIEERSTTLALIDEARSIIPKLSAKVVAFLAFKVFQSIKFGYEFTADKYDEFLDKLSVLTNDLDSISSLDIDFLMQLGCIHTGWEFMENYDKKSPMYFEALLLKLYDLFYRHSIPQMALFSTLADSKYSQNDKCLIGGGFDYDGDGYLIRFKYLRSDVYLDVYKGKEELKDVFFKFKELCIPYSLQEIKDYHIEKNKNWDKVFKLFEVERINLIKLNPVAVYIGAKQLEKVCGMKIPLSIFYKEL